MIPKFSAPKFKQNSSKLFFFDFSFKHDGIWSKSWPSTTLWLNLSQCVYYWLIVIPSILLFDTFLGLNPCKPVGCFSLQILHYICSGTARHYNLQLFDTGMNTTHDIFVLFIVVILYFILWCFFIIDNIHSNHFFY